MRLSRLCVGRAAGGRSTATRSDGTPRGTAGLGNPAGGPESRGSGPRRGDRLRRRQPREAAPAAAAGAGRSPGGAAAALRRRLRDPAALRRCGGARSCLQTTEPCRDAPRSRCPVPGQPAAPRGAPPAPLRQHGGRGEGSQPGESRAPSLGEREGRGAPVAPPRRSR